MKKLCAFVVIGFFSHPTIAAVYTLCNMAYCQAVPGVVFTTFDDVQNYATDGDIIYVQGSSFSYGDIDIYKRLTLVGAGHHPNKQNALTSMFHHIEIHTSGVQLIGLTFSHAGSYYTNNCVIKKCRITGEAGRIDLNATGATGWLIQGNIFESVDNYANISFGGSEANNVIVENNVISGSGMKILGIRNYSGHLSYILNNLFLGNGQNQTLYDLQYVNIENNIFVGDNSPDDNYSVTNCVMNNNIVWCNDNTLHSPGINNLVNADPLFANFPGPGSLFSYSYDFSLSSSSPGHNTGTDGTDRGVFGGIGFKFTMTGEPAIAEITALSITSGATVSPGGNITISVTSKSVH